MLVSLLLVEDEGLEPETMVTTLLAPLLREASMWKGAGAPVTTATAGKPWMSEILFTARRQAALSRCWLLVVSSSACTGDASMLFSFPTRTQPAIHLQHPPKQRATFQPATKLLPAVRVLGVTELQQNDRDSKEDNLDKYASCPGCGQK
jgi:hypothetical protein